MSSKTHKRLWVLGFGLSVLTTPLSDCFDEQCYTLELFPQISAIYLCPDYDGWFCWVVDRCQLLTESREFGYEGRHFRKPGAGMLKFALWQYGISHLKAFYIGDAREDKSAALGAGVQYIDANIWRVSAA